MIRRVPINPRLPKNFDNCANEDRSATQIRRWWDRPFVVTVTWDQMQPRAAEGARFEQHRENWFRAWPSGTRYDVRCLDGGAWDRSTCWGNFSTLEAALECAQGPGPAWRKHLAAISPPPVVR